MNTLRMTPEQVAAHQLRVSGLRTVIDKASGDIGVVLPKQNKYRSRKTGGYSSAKEARRAAELKLLLAAGTVTDLMEQVSYELIPRQYENGVMVERECRYVADFVYILTGHATPIVEDTKGIRTKDYIIKRKLMLQVHGVRVRET